LVQLQRGINMHIGTFPFGQPIHSVNQTDKTPKKVFVLGVYASAVHAKWIEPDGKTIIKAVGVKSEPYIFWRGENADNLIADVQIPREMGRLEPANSMFNGPSGLALDEKILHPIGIDREDAWICDLVPHSCMNPQQKKALTERYVDKAKAAGLPELNWPSVPHILSDEERRQNILQELKESQARVLIVLGDQPIKWFLKYYDNSWKKLSDFGNDTTTYGRVHRSVLDGMEIDILPLAHPRQIGKLGRSSKHWYQLHENWIDNKANGLLSPVIDL
jgi:uracil-DNA glycosylase